MFYKKESISSATADMCIESPTSYELVIYKLQHYFLKPVTLTYMLKTTREAFHRS